MQSNELEGSVRAGAEAIKGLMAGVANEQPDQPKEESEAPEEVQTIIEDEEETEETSEEVDDEESDESDEELEAEVIEIKANGETHQLDLDEVKRLASAGMDYTQKMQKMKEEVKAEAEKLAEEKTKGLEEYRNNLVEATELVESLYSSPLVAKEQLDKLLADGDTEEYLRLKGQEESREKLLQEVRRERDKVKKEQQEEQQKTLQQEAQKQTAILLDKIPELKKEENQKALLSHLKHKGLTDNEIGSLYDARFLEIAEESRKYRELIKEGVKPKKKVKSPNVTKKKGTPTSKAAKAQEAAKAQRQKLKQSGNIRDAASIIKESFL